LAVGEAVIRTALKVPISVLISTLATAYIIEEVFRIEFGLTPITLPSVRGVSVIWGIPINNQWLLVLLTSIIMSSALLLFLKYTSTGKAIRATAESWEESMIIGVNPLKVFRVTMVIAGAYAAIAGIVLSPLKAVVPDMGWSPLFTAFTIVALGGMGSIKGTIIAATIYGFAEQSITWFFGGAYAEIVPLIIIILVLLLKPSGLFGERA